MIAKRHGACQPEGREGICESEAAVACPRRCRERLRCLLEALAEAEDNGKVALDCQDATNLGRTVGWLPLTTVLHADADFENVLCREILLLDGQWQPARRGRDHLCSCVSVCGRAQVVVIDRSGRCRHRLRSDRERRLIVQSMATSLASGGCCECACALGCVPLADFIDVEIGYDARIPLSWSMATSRA